MASVLADPRLYEFTGGTPPTVGQLAASYESQVAGPDRLGETWHNWIVRLADGGRAVGFVQSTVIGEEADMAWVVGARWQRRGYATEAARVMSSWLVEMGATRLVAHIHPDHVASGRVAASLGLQPTDEVDSDGEVVWSFDVGGPGTTS